MTLPYAFQQQMRALLDTSYDSFTEALSELPPVSIRLNPYKGYSKHYFSNVASIPWNDQGLYLKERPVFTLDPAFHGGAYYVQEASSMLLLAALQEWLPRQDTPLRILDLCAAPGGKTTLLRALGKQHLLVANEVINSRYTILQENLIRWGAMNTVVTNHDVKDFGHLSDFFDVVLVDAPCSGEGLFRKDAKAINEWSPESVQLCSARQKRILAGAQQLVKPGGLLVYCTCTYNTSENDQNVEWLLLETPLQNLSIALPQTWGVEERPTKGGRGYQCYPHKVQGEGFYFAGFRKPEQVQGAIDLNKDSKKEKQKSRKSNAHPTLSTLSRKEVEALQAYFSKLTEVQLFYNYKNEIGAIGKEHWEDVQYITKDLRKYEVGTTLGSLKKKDFVPGHALALSAQLKTTFPTIALDKSTALRYLKKEAINEVLAATKSRGWHLVSFQRIALGWIKVLPNRVNNYLPKQWRIRMDISEH